MSLNIPSTLSLYQSASNIDRMDLSEQAPNINKSSNNKGDYDRVDLSKEGLKLAQKQGSLLSALPDLILPTPDNVRKLSTGLAEKMGKIFREAGIGTTPPVEFKVDPYGSISASGNRQDLGRINSLLNDNPDLQKSIRDLNAISSHAHAIYAEGRLQFQEEYLASSNPEQVVAKYAQLFGRQIPTEISLRFNGSEVDVLANGKSWISGA